VKHFLAFRIAIASLLSLSATLNATSVTLDHIDGLGRPMKYSSDKIINVGCRATLYFRYTNDQPYPIGLIDNGFRVWNKGGSPLNLIHLDTLPIDFGSGTGWRDAFDQSFDFYSSEADMPVCTLGVGGSSGTGQGLPAGFDEVAVSLYVWFYVIEYQDTLCVDSTWYPPNHSWLWSPAGGDPGERPEWGGPYCFLAETIPCGYPQFTDCHNEINVAWSEPITHDFHADTFQGSDVYYDIHEGPGQIDTVTGLWTASIPQDQIGHPFTVRVAAWEEWCSSCNVAECVTTMHVYMLGDMNMDGASDISDLIFLADNMFGDGEPPQVIELADVNGDGALDISDLIYLVDYMFGDGPPPVNPWA